MAPPITWIGTDGDFFTGHPFGDPLAIVLHTEAGFTAGTDSTFNDPNRDASTHFSVGIDGAVHQYVLLDNSAWGNGVLESGERWTGHFGHAGVNPNYLSVSIETEDFGKGMTPVSPQQYAHVRDLIGAVILPRWPSIKTLTGHRVISPGSRDQCPGDRWTKSGAFVALAQELKLEAFI